MRFGSSSKVIPVPDSPQPGASNRSLLPDGPGTSRNLPRISGLRLRWWFLLLVVAPLAALTVVAGFASWQTPDQQTVALTLAQEVTLWVGAWVRAALAPVPAAAASLRLRPVDPSLCSRERLTPAEILLFFQLASLGPHIVRLVGPSGDLTDVWFANDTFLVTGASSCAFLPPDPTLSPPTIIVAASAPSTLPFDVPADLTLGGSILETPTACNLQRLGVVCPVGSSNQTTATLFVPLATLTRRLTDGAVRSAATVAVVAALSPEVVVASSLSQPAVGPDVAVVTQPITFLPDTLAANLSTVVVVPFAASLEPRMMLPTLIPAVIVFAMFSALAIGLERHLSGRICQLSQAVAALHGPPAAGVRDSLALKTLVHELGELLEAYQAAVKATPVARRYAPEIPTPRSRHDGLPQSESSESSLCGAHIRAARPTRQDSLPITGLPGHSHSLLELENNGEHPFVADLLDSGQQNSQLVTVDASCTNVTQRLGSVLVVEIWYQSAPLSVMAGDCQAQQSIGEAFLQMVVACLEETRGTVVCIDVGRLVASWNIFSSQATHEYWACLAALEIRNRFPTSLNALCNLFSKGHIVKHDLQVYMAVARGPLTTGCVRASGHSVTVLHGDVLRMADRLVTLNSACQTTILMPQQTFEAVQGYVTAEMVDYVLDVRKEQIVGVYQLLGTDTVDAVGFSDLYKDALICFSRHEFQEADHRLAQCQRLLQDAGAKFMPARRGQCVRLQRLIMCFERMTEDQFETTVPNPYFRRFYSEWESFDVLEDSLVSATPLRELDPVVQSSTNDVLFHARAGLTTVTADLLNGILSKEGNDSEDNLSPVWQRMKGRKPGLGNSDELPSDTHPAISIADLDARTSFPIRPDSPDQRQHSGMEREGSSTVSDVGFGGRSFRDIFGRMWRCSKECLGRGGFGTVYLGIDEQGKMSAIKEHVFNCNSEKIRQKVTVNEIVMLWNLQHKNIVSYQGCAVVGSSLAIIMEYISCGSLEFIVETFGCISEGVAVQYTRDTIRGLAFLHAHNVVHLDIKPANVLLDQHGTCKLADFGTASALSNLMDLENGLMGTPVYMAPERVSGSTSDLSDIWSWGITLAEVLSGKRAYDPDLPPEAILFGLYAGTLDPAIPDGLSLHATSFLRVCLARDPTQRAHAEDLLGHPFLL